MGLRNVPERAVWWRACLVLCVVAAGAAGARGQSQLWDNGRWRTGVGNGYEGADTSVVDSVNDRTVPGQRFWQDLSHFADDFTIADDGWNLSSMTWYAYSIITGFDPAVHEPWFDTAYVAMWDGEPGNGGTRVHGDASTSGPNRFTSVEWTGAYRVKSTVLDVWHDRAIMALSIDMSWLPPLPTGTYWVEISIPRYPIPPGFVGPGGLSFAYANPVVPADPADYADHNARQWEIFDPDTVPAWWDVDGKYLTGANAHLDPRRATIEAQDFPFELYGEIAQPVAGDANGDFLVNATDLGALAANWQGTGKTLEHGDFNGDGVVNLFDLAALAGSWEPTPASAPAPLGAATVPEPASAWVMAWLAAVALLGRRAASLRR